ncbi:histidine kinase [Bradyrhizobium sp. STM 3562]|uniref:sensor histidine kinase n=1 Tax=Bradyrhizobium sp. STM 3562 TaxID=578924 RepID=UPI00388F0A5C
MWTFARGDLKLRLTLRVAAISALCFAAISAYFLFEADSSVHARIDRIADISAKTLELQQNKIQWVNNPRKEFPDLEVIAASVMMPGLCIAYRGSGGDILQRFCDGASGETSEPPQAFAAFYRRFFNPGREAARPVLSGGSKVGEAVAWVDPAVLTADAWHEAGRLTVVLAVALPLLCVLVYAALARALRPTRLIRRGLERIAANDLTARLPPFDLAELSAISNVFNQLSENLATALAQRNELTRRLIALQDDERRHLARELHDEFGQSLTAIRALAASVHQGAGRDCPTLLAECDSIARIAAAMMETLRGALFRLRPPDVEELGLAASLQGLISGWNGRGRGQTQFEIALSGDVEHLPAAIAGELYRIAQEALTNAAKHADATRVVVRLTMREARPVSDGCGAGEIELTVDDDGRAGDQTIKSGMGLLGMRERVASLGGRLSFEIGPSQGSVLRVVIPLASPPTARAEDRSNVECAA